MSWFNRYITLCLLSLVLPGCLHAQNLVSNCNFEDYTNCPEYLSQVVVCKNWHAYHLGSTDYFNKCGKGDVKVPLNKYGYQQPLRGNAYIGIYTYDYNDSVYKEYVAQSIAPLVIGSAYEVSMFVSLGDSSAFTTDDLGVWFYDKGPTTTLSAGQNYLPVKPHISFSSYGRITDTANWVQLKGTFLADSNYRNIVIGGFGNSATTHQLSTGVNPKALYKYAYYYIDSVTLVLSSKMMLLPMDSVRCGTDTIKQGFFAATAYGVGNIFTLELSDSSGSFTNAKVVGTLAATTGNLISGLLPAGIVPGLHYRTRIKTSNPVDSVGPGNYFAISKTLPGAISAASNSPVCAGNTLYLNAANNTPDAHYIWSGPNNFKDTVLNTSRLSAKSIDSGIYTITAWIGGCKLSASVNGTVSDALKKADATLTKPACTGDTLLLHAAPVGPVSLSVWTGPGGFTASTLDAYIVHPTIAASGDYIFNCFYNGCNRTDTVNVVVNPSPADPGGHSNSPVCAGDSLLFFGNDPVAGTTITWAGPQSFSSSSIYIPFYNAKPSLSGTYTLTARLGECLIVDTVKVQVKPMPPVPIGSSNSPLDAGSPLKLNTSNIDTNFTYTWIGPNGFFSKLPNTTLNAVKVQHSGTYIIVAGLDGCITSDTIQVTVIGNITDDSTYIKVFPNANNGKFHISTRGLRDQEVPFSIHAANGQVVYRAAATTKNKMMDTEVDLRNALASGIYTLHLFMDSKGYTVQILVVRD